MIDVTPRATASSVVPDFLMGGGEMGRRMREMDWSRTRLGAPREWPAPLRTAARIVLASRHPVCVWWGADCALLYNDACQSIVGAEPASALGMPAPAAWLEGPSQIAVRGEKETHYALALSPVPGEGGALGGVLCTFFDITASVAAERSLRTVDTLEEVSRDLTSELDLQALLQKVTDAGTRITGAAFGAFFYNMVDEKGESYQLFTLTGAPREAFERLGMPRATAVFKPTFEGQGGAVRSDDITQDPRYGRSGPHHGQPKGHLPVRSYLAVPVISRTGEVLGGLFFGHPQRGVFDERAERGALGVAAHAAVALDNARHFGRARDELERRGTLEEELRGDIDRRKAAEAELAATKDELAAQVESLTQLHELAMRLGGMTELPAMLQSVLETAVGAQGADFGLVWLHVRETGSLVAAASRNFGAEALRHFQRLTPGPDGGAAGNAFARHCRWIIEDVEADPGFERFREGASAAGFRAVHSTPIVTSSGELLGVISVHFARKHQPSQRDMQVADVCARHAADAIEGCRGQKALRESERLYRAIGESMDFGVWICDATGRNTYASESFLRLSGLTQEQCSGFGWGSILHPEDRERTIAEWQRVVDEGGKWDVEHRIRGVDGKWHSVLARGVPIRDDQGAITGWAGINLDIERLKQVEAELRELDQRKNEFLATLAHELRNPLAPLRNGLEVMKLAADPGMLEKARAMMERQLSQMVRLVDDLLDVSRVSRGKIELRRADIDIAAVLRNAIETSQPLVAERMHRLVTRLPRERIVVHADLTRLSQVFWNLLNNAAKYTLPGGVIELEVGARNSEVVVSIRDNGIGIPPDMQARVFDIFTQVDRSLEKSQGGLGIGLSIAKRLVEMHGGTLTVRSDGHGKGSEFTVRLPASVDAPTADAEPEARIAAAPGRHRVLIAEDNADSASTLGILLEAAGHDVRIAHDGKEAVGVAREFQPDVVLLDIGMPRLNGYDACREMRAESWARRSHFIALTGWAQPEDRERAHASGFDRHLVKPVEPAALEQLIRELPARD